MQKTVNERVKFLRQRSGLALRSFCEVADVSHTTLNNIEKASEKEVGSLYVRSLKKLCKTLLVSEKWLFEGKGDMFIGGTEEENFERIKMQATENSDSDLTGILVAERKRADSEKQRADAEKKRADELSRNNSFLLGILDKLTNGKGLEIANFLLAPEKGKVAKLRVVNS